jgi:hypothetical protein
MISEEQKAKALLEALFASQPMVQGFAEGLMNKPTNAFAMAFALFIIEDMIKSGASMDEEEFQSLKTFIKSTYDTLKEKGAIPGIGVYIRGEGNRV